MSKRVRLTGPDTDLTVIGPNSGGTAAIRLRAGQPSRLEMET